MFASNFTYELKPADRNILKLVNSIFEFVVRCHRWSLGIAQFRAKVLQCHLCTQHVSQCNWINIFRIGVSKLLIWLWSTSVVEWIGMANIESLEFSRKVALLTNVSHYTMRLWLVWIVRVMTTGWWWTGESWTNERTYRNFMCTEHRLNAYIKPKQIRFQMLKCIMRFCIRVVLPHQLFQNRCELESGFVIAVASWWFSLEPHSFPWSFRLFLLFCPMNDLQLRIVSREKTKKFNAIFRKSACVLRAIFHYVAYFNLGILLFYCAEMAFIMFVFVLLLMLFAKN